MAVTAIHHEREESVLVLYETHAGAELALEAFQQAGLPMSHLSLVAREYDAGGDAANSGAGTRGEEVDQDIWRRLQYRLFCSLRVSVPGIGSLIVMGPLVGRVQSSFEGGVLGGAAGLLRATLAGIGVANGSVVKYGLALKAGNVLVLVCGPQHMVRNATVVLAAHGSRPVMARVDPHLRVAGDSS